MFKKLFIFVIGLSLIAGAISFMLYAIAFIGGIFALFAVGTGLVWLVKELSVKTYSIKNNKPLTYDQIVLLSKKYASYYYKKAYKFKKETVSIDPAFKTAMDRYGAWYEIEEPLSSFPSYVAKLLQGKHHEWVVIGIESDKVVRYMWVNKGPDNQSVSISCDLEDIVNKATEVDGYTVLRFHNHPNPDPKKYTTLLASEQDKISAKSCSEYINKRGLNWIDFVCSRGEFVKFYSSQSELFEAHNYTVSDIIDRSNITKEMDAELQKEYARYCGVKGLNLVWIGIIFVVICAFLLNPINNKIDDGNNSAQTTNVSTYSFEGIDEYDIVQLLNNVEGITGTEVATSKTDKNKLLNDLCSSVVFFSYDEVELSDSEKDKTIIDIGTDAGGCIEVFYNEDEASSRMTKLKATSLLAGGSYRCGVVVIRTSAKLSKAQQKDLQNKILSELENYVAGTFNRETDDWYTASIEDFEYVITKGIIHLEKYNGTSNSVIIPSYYTVENTDLPIKIGSAFKNTQVVNIVISEGIQQIASDAFSGASCLKHLYIPSTAEYINYLCKDIPSGEILYYGSTETNWRKINKTQRDNISFKKIVFEASPQDCIDNKDTFINVGNISVDSLFTPLEDFSYDIKNGALVLGKYKGKNSFVNISPTYFVYGEEIPVVELNNTFTLKSVNTVIVPEGITTLSAPLFNSCGVKKVFLPSTLNNVPLNFWGYFHDLDTLYFGGTEENFNKLLGSLSRWDIDVQHVEYNCVASALAE